MNCPERNLLSGKILSFHFRNKWILSATIIFSIMGFLNIFLADEVVGWAIMFIVFGPYPILVLFAWLITLRSR